MVRNKWELGEFSKVQKFQNLARMLTVHLSVNSDGFSCTMPSEHFKPFSAKIQRSSC